MSRLYFDLETNGLLPEVSKVHLNITANLDTGELRTYVPADRVEEYRALFPGEYIGPEEEGLDALEAATYLAGQNIIGYDLRVLKHLFPDRDFRTGKRLCDTLVLSKLVFPDIKDGDAKRIAAGTFPPKLMFRPHSLEAWGHRLGDAKGDYSAEMKAKGLDPWADLNPEMFLYGRQDRTLGVKFWEMLRRKAPDPRAVGLEMAVAEIIQDQEDAGFPFDVKKAQALYSVLSQRREVLRLECEALFPPWFVSLGEHTTKATRRVKRPDLGTVPREVRHKTSGKLLRVVDEPVTENYFEGVVHSNVKLQTFNPGSRAHIADRLKKLYGWKPVAFGKDGIPTVDDDILSSLPFPPCKLLSEFFMVDKRIGALAEGKQAWLKKVKDDGCIHGRMNTNGAGTGRGTHMDPNLGQVPSTMNADGPVPYGRECRELFYAGPSWAAMVGIDASGLELRALGARLSQYDGGAFIEAVLNGDIHWVNATNLGLVPQGTKRDKHIEAHELARAVAKRFIYAFLYGAGGYLIGDIMVSIMGITDAEIADLIGKEALLKKARRELEYLGIPWTKRNAAVCIKGLILNATFLKRTPAIGLLQEELAADFKATKSIRGLDGRHIPLRSKHSALNFRLQSDGAIICKKWMQLCHEAFAARGWVSGVDYQQFVWVHDELQIGCRTKEIAEELGKLAASMVAKAGEFFKYPCPLDGDYGVGLTWAETH